MASKQVAGNGQKSLLAFTLKTPTEQKKDNSNWFTGNRNMWENVQNLPTFTKKMVPFCL